MAEYIDRDKAIKYMEEHKRVGFETRTILAANEDAIIKFLCEKCPAEDVAPLRHGKWEYNEPTINLKGCNVCSECGYHDYEVLRHSRFYYCPNCGAKMGG